MSINLIDKLREQTRALHTTLDYHSLLTNLLSPNANMATYTSVLVRLYMIHAPVEVELRALECRSNLLRQLAWSTHRQKAALLAQDIRVLGTEPPSPPDDLKLPRLRTESEQLGLLYVLEGATLGGQVISRRLRRVPCIPPNSLTYFSVYGQDTGLRWQQFVTVCNDYGRAHPDEQSIVVHAAQETFQLFIDWMCDV